MAEIQEVSKGVWRWDGVDVDHGFPIIGHIVSCGGGVVLVDPPATSGSVEEIRKAGEPRAMLLTSQWHVRGAGKWKRALGIPIAAPTNAESELAEVDAKADQVLGEGDEYQGWRVLRFHAQGKKSAYAELAFWNPSTKTALVGDLFSGEDDGSVQLGPELFSEVRREEILPFVKWLLDLSPELILSAHIGERTDAIELLQGLLGE